MKRQILISSLILLFMSGFASAVTRDVDSISGPYLTIQSAINAAVDGALDKIFEVTVHDKVTSKIKMPPVVPDDAPQFIQQVTGEHGPKTVSGCNIQTFHRYPG